MERTLNGISNSIIGTIQGGRSTGELPFWGLAILCFLGAPRAAMAQDDGRMREVVENVRANEELYRNLEVRIRKHFQSGTFTHPQPNYIERAEGNARFVYQNGMVYFRNDEESKDLGGNVQKPDTLLGYDGETMRIIEQNAIANLREGWVDEPRLLRPHTMLLSVSAGVRFPLSEYLIGGKPIRVHPNYKDVKVSVFHEGEEKIDGLRCIKIRTEYHPDAWKHDKADIRHTWLAVERNYLPVRTEARQYTMLDYAPQEVGRAEDFREIAPGVWFPFKASLVVYDGPALYYDKKLVAINTTEWTVDQANLDPNYDVSFFRDVPIPDGMTVYVIKGGKTVQKYVKGGMIRTRPRERSWTWPAVGAALTVVGSILIYRVYRRFRSRHGVLV
jgi:hypothetical protein